MARFYVHLRQGGGCDYSIGCGQRLEPFPACVTTLEEAAQALTAGDFYPYQLACYGDSVKEATILEVVDTSEVDVEGLRAAAAANEARVQAAAKEAEERKLYESLKKRFGD